MSTASGQPPPPGHGRSQSLGAIAGSSQGDPPAPFPPPERRPPSSRQSTATFVTALEPVEPVVVQAEDVELISGQAFALLTILAAFWAATLAGMVFLQRTQDKDETVDVGGPVHERAFVLTLWVGSSNLVWALVAGCWAFGVEFLLGKDRGFILEC